MAKFFSVVSALCLLCTLHTAHPAQASPLLSGKTVRVMVQLVGPPVAADMNLKVRNVDTRGRFRIDTALPSARTYGADLQAYQNRELAFLHSRGLTFSVGRTFHLLLDGFVLTLPSRELPALRSMPNIRSALFMMKFRPLLDRSVQLVNAPQAWTQLGGGPNAGRGEMIADLDTGIDIKNPCFSDAGFPAPPLGRRSDTTANYALTNNKVIVARAFGTNPTLSYSAADVEGHGTFTASIEACDYNTPTPLGTHISGMAPAAYLFNYNVFAETGSNPGNEDPVVAGLEAALQDGADVANLSLGAAIGAGDPKLDPWTTVVSQVTKAGLTVVVAAGNAGPGQQTYSSPGSAPDSITVGAVSNSRTVSQSVLIGGPTPVGPDLVKLQAKSGSHAFSGDVGPAQLVYVGLARKPGDDPANPTADDLAGKNLTGKIALIQRGISFFGTKIDNVAKAGAIGAIIFDNHYELNVFQMDVKDATLPAMSISQKDGQALLAWVAAHPDATATLHPVSEEIPEQPDVLSDFSSRGYGPNFIIKPDLVAPGQDIYAATESETPNNIMYDASGFTRQEGTSFSSPHVAGAAALILQKHPTWTPAQVKSALMQTATNVVSLPGTDQKPVVTDVGAGMLDAASALSAPLAILPQSISFGQVNVGAGPVQASQKVTVSDLNGGSGTWTLSLDQLVAAPGLTLSPGSALTIGSGGHADLTLGLSATASTPNGDYQGYIVLTRGTRTVHVPYLVHLISKTVLPNSVLLVDDTQNRVVPQDGSPVPARKDVTKWYTQTLDNLHRSYTYWDEAVYGEPVLADLKRASAVIYFTGANVNGFAPAVNDSEALMGPLSPTDVSTMHDYLSAGGRLFVTGIGAALSDLSWTTFVLGAGPAGLSLYDNSSNDVKDTGGLSPPSPSAKPDSGLGGASNKWLFSGLKAIDFSTKGDGAGDNVAVKNTAVGDTFGTDLVGVPALSPYSGTDQFLGTAYGQGVLQTTDLTAAKGLGGADVGVVTSDEPTLKHVPTYPGRSVFFSFGFEGINNNTGYATREQVLSRIFAWFIDTPTVRVSNGPYPVHRAVTLKSVLKSGAAGGAVKYTWQVGTSTLKSTAKPTTYKFSHTGTFRLRVQVTDHLGHQAVSPWKTIHVK